MSSKRAHSTENVGDSSVQRRGEGVQAQLGTRGGGLGRREGAGVGDGSVWAAGNRIRQQHVRMPVGGAARPRTAQSGLTSAPRLLGLPLWTRRQSRSAPRCLARALARLGLGSGSSGGPRAGPGASGSAPWPAPRLSSWRSPSSSALLRPRLRQVSACRSDQSCCAESPGPWRSWEESVSVG